MQLKTVSQWRSFLNFSVYSRNGVKWSNERILEQWSNDTTEIELGIKANWPWTPNILLQGALTLFCCRARSPENVYHGARSSVEGSPELYSPPVAHSLWDPELSMAATSRAGNTIGCVHAYRFWRENMSNELPVSCLLDSTGTRCRC